MSIYIEIRCLMKLLELIWSRDLADFNNLYRKVSPFDILSLNHSFTQRFLFILSTCLFDAINHINNNDKFKGTMLHKRFLSYSCI